MRVLTVGNMYPPHHLGGYELVWQGAVDHMRAEGHDVTVLTTTTRIHADAGADPPHVHRELGWYWEDHGFPAVSLRRAMTTERADARVLDEHVAGGVDAVLLWSMGGLPLALAARPAGAGIPVGAVVHDLWPAYGPRVDARTAHGGRLAGARRAVWRTCGFAAGDPLAAVDGWSFNSTWLRDALANAVPAIAASTALRVDHPGIDLDRLWPAGSQEWQGRLAVVGRLDERKGISHVIEALPLLPDCSLVVTGGGDPAVAAGLADLAARLGVCDRVRFAGPADDVRAAYAAADAVVFPVTWDEPFGLVPLEAMAVGRPVVATATGGAAEYLEDGVNARVVEPGDAGAIAAAVRALASDPGLRDRLVAGGARTAGSRSAAAFGTAIERFAEDVADRRH